MKRTFPITPNNSSVLGYSAASPAWRKWWQRTAWWSRAFPTRGGKAPLHVPLRGELWDGAAYRVRPTLKRVQHDIGSVRVERVRGRWCWIYPEAER
jgi:hypothetical protein